MKKITVALGLAAATVFAAPLAAQSRNDGPWWDPANTGSRSGSTARVDRDGRIVDRDGRIYDRNGRIYDDGRVYDSRRADGQWRREGRDRSGNIIYVRTRYDSRGNLIRERARRDSLGRYRVFDRDVLRVDRRRDNDRNNDGWWDREDRRRNGRDRNDRWAQNNGHDNGRHLGWEKNGKAQGSKAKGKNRR